MFIDILIEIKQINKGLTMSDFTVSLQGMDRDFQPNGEYESIELGEKTPDELLDILKKVEKALPLDGKDDDDLCPPEIIVEKGDTQFVFDPWDDKLHFIGANSAEVSPMEAVAIVSGEKDAGEMAIRSREESGIKPACKPEIPPTDRVNVDWTDIDTSTGAPQVSETVYKSKAWRSAFIQMPIWGILSLGVGITLLFGPGGLGGPGWIFVGAAALLFGTWQLTKGKRFEELYVGFDWKTNTMWATRSSQKKVHYNEDANMVTDLVLDKTVFKTDTVLVPGEDAIAGGGKETTWKIMAHYAQPDHIPWLVPYCEFASKGEAKRVLAKLQALLAAQT
jgi:hypothetical protein